MFLDDKQFKRIGNVTETIVRFAMELGAEQIVMGARGTSLFADPVPGSVANTVVQLAALPVTLVRKELGVATI